MFRLIPHAGACRPGSVNDVDRMFRTFFGEGGSQWGPAVDVVETKDAFVFRAELPGIDPKKIEISLENDRLTLSGEKSEGDEKREGSWYRLERRYGTFSRSFALGKNVDAAKAEAHAENGVLTVTLPKREESKPKSITVKVK